MSATSGAAKNSGQRRTAVKRILCIDPVADELVLKLTERAKRLRYGDPIDAPCAHSY